ncbi:MAG: hypothetical protein JSW58_05770, partial [Candidatus Latescibacterota bacterium]
GRRKIRRRSKAYPFLLSTTVAEHTYKGFFIGDFVEGGRAIFTEGVVDISPTDAERAEISDGDEVLVASARFERSWRARIVGEQPEGSLHVTLGGGDGVGESPQPVSIRKSDV